MPELPEVETIRRALERTLPGREVAEVLVREHRLRWPVDECGLRSLLLNQTIHSIDRRAKYLIIRTYQESVLIIHLGMSGKLLLLTENPELHKHDHVIFRFRDGSELRFRDQRRFGLVEAITYDVLPVYARFQNLGPEPLDSGTTAEILHQRSKHLKKPVKNLVMDAGFLVGVGNIYANEALHQAKVHPQTAVNRLNLATWEELLRAIQNVLQDAILKGGTTLTDFVNSDGETGYFQLSLAVYGREGESCFRCQHKIERIVQAGRSTYLCPECQRLVT